MDRETRVGRSCLFYAAIIDYRNIQVVDNPASGSGSGDALIGNSRSEFVLNGNAAVEQNDLLIGGTSNDVIIFNKIKTNPPSFSSIRCA